MRRADFFPRERGVLNEAGAGIGAEQREFLFLAQPMPEVLQSQSRTGLTTRPEDGHHLTECANGPPVGPRTPDYAVDAVGKQTLVRPAFAHELRQRGFCVERDVLVLVGRGLEVNAPGCEPELQQGPMLWCGDDDHAFVVSIPAATKLAKASSSVSSVS